MLGKEYEMDEMRTFVGSKKNKYWIAYALQKDNRRIVELTVGRRTKTTLRQVLSTLLLANAKMIYTDGLNIYGLIVPKEIHKVTKYNINYIERMNLTLRTQIKRLNRRTICFSKSLVMLTAVLKLYIWG